MKKQTITKLPRNGDYSKVEEQIEEIEISETRMKAQSGIIHSFIWAITIIIVVAIIKVMIRG